MAPAKAKKQTMSLGTFLTDESLGSWADEMEDMPLPSDAGESRTGYGDRRNFTMSSLGSDRGNYPTREREQLPLPTKPPYTAHLGNLSFDITSSDIETFFGDCNVTSVRIVEDKLEHKPKGFGYVEFATLDGLKKALEFTGSQLQGRNVRVSVAEPPKERQETRDFNDWTRKGPLPDLPTQRRVSDRGGFRGDNMSDAGSERSSRRAGFADDGRVRDLNNWERKGPLSPITTPTLGLADSGRQRSHGEFRRNSPSWGEGKSQDGSRTSRREYERAPTAAELDNQWRSKMKPDASVKSPASSREPSNPPSPVAAPPLAVRPKLNLQKRTVSDDKANEAAPTHADAKSSPFGAAKPIDTAAREKAIEERREKLVRDKKEAEAKAKKATTEATPAKDEDSAQDGAIRNGQPNTAIDQPHGGKNFEVLSQDVESSDSESGWNGESKVPFEKVPKPKDVVHAPQKERFAQNWRKVPDNKDFSTPRSTTAAVDEEGWSTVSKPQKGRRGNQHSKPIAF